MKINKLRSTYILFIVLLRTGYTCVRTITKSMLGTLTKQWCDEELQRWVKRVIKLIKAKCTLINPNNVAPKAGQPTIIMCNHSSLFDIPLSFWAFPNESIRMLAKSELFKIPFFGKAMIASGFPKITRHNRKQAIQELEGVAQLLSSGVVMWIAPEGTRSKNGRLSSFKKGGFITAINTKATIIPIGIRGANMILPAKTMRLNLGQEIEVHIGNPIDASQYTLEEKEQLIAVVHQEMKQLLEG